MKESSSFRFRFDLRYDGAGFHGWAAQDHLRTVEGELTAALETVTRQKVKFTVAGRTDAGVHASAQVAHVDLDAPAVRKVGTSIAHLRRLRDRLNRLLAAAYASVWRPLVQRGLAPAALVEKGMSDLVITDIQMVNEDFDARFSATGRHYRYLIVDEPAALNPITRSDRWWTPYGVLDVAAMSRAGALLVGSHDFLSFCKPRPGATTIRTLREVTPQRVPTSSLLPNGENGTQVEIRVAADAFCHSMVRALVGALVEVGRGARDEEWIKALVQDPARTHPVPVAPARGLTLVGVDYPPAEQWRERSIRSRALRGTPRE